MSDVCDLSFQERSLIQQGYEDYTPAQLRQMEWGLRFTPLVCSLITLTALLTQQPWLLFGVAALGFWAFVAPAAHPMDLIYNHVVRPIFRAVKLPPNPLQRRLACLSAGVLNATAGVLFLLGYPWGAYVIGGALLSLQAVVISTHFCALSWVYEGIARLMGNWTRPLDSRTARQLIDAGAMVIDVRSPHEFAEMHLRGTVNVPLETLQANLSSVSKGPVLVHCKSGMRSDAAIKLLKKHGYRDVYNLGTYDRAKEILTGMIPERSIAKP